MGECSRLLLPHWLLTVHLLPSSISAKTAHRRPPRVLARSSSVAVGPIFKDAREALLLL